MNSFHSFPPSSFLPLLIFFFTNLIVSSHLYSDCTSSFNCGTITNLTYPFWGRTRPVSCGHPDLKLECEQNMATIEIMKVKYHILEAKPNSKILKLSRQDFIDGSFCRPQFINTTLDPTLFEYGPPGYVNLTLLYGCAPLFVSVPGQFSCPGFGIGYMELGFYVGLGTCNVSVVIPVLEEGLLMKLWDLRKMNEVIKQGFYVKLKVESDCEECLKSGGVCGYDPKLNQPTCYCRDSPRRSKTCPTSTSSVNGASQVPKIPPEAQKKNQKPLKIGLAIGAVFLLAIFVACWSFYIKQRKKYVLQSKDLSTPPSSKENNNNNVSTTLITTNLSLTRSIPPYPSSTLSLQNRSSYFGAQVFSYMDLQKATDNFHPSRELGNGGYGTVYYGKLDDGREVAVKCLYENNFKRVEQFMNEVEILTRLQDRNLVKLYGCTSRHGQELLLVYEYIPNGTVADHIHGNKRTNPGPLTWPVRLNIAVETAHALAYLHRSDIIHRDVKTSNILLDNKFHVKVADFGLCRLFPLDVSHVSTAPQGTPGYVDPEYYQCYQLTDRSDVFSFGVVLIELISSLQAVDTSRHRHDINLANMAVNKIQNHALDELVDPSLGFDRDYGVRQMVTSVAELAFRCLQQNREMRPSMEEVVDVLRRIGDEKLGAEKAEVVDVGADDVGLLKHMLPPLSPVSVVNDNGFS